MGTFRPTAVGGTIATTDSTALALIDVRGLPPGTRVYNEAVGHMFALTTSTAALVPNVVVEVFSIVGARWILDTSDAEVQSVTGTAPITVNNADSRNPVVALAASGVTAATYSLATVTVDATGRVTAASSGTDAGITQLTGDGTAGPGSGSQALTLATVNSNVGAFTNASVTVNAKGQVTAAASGTGGVTQLTGDVTAGPGSGSVAATLAAGSASVLNSGTLNASRLPAFTGDVTTSAGSAATTLAAGSAAALNSGTLDAARLPALTGDVTSSAGSAATTLAAGSASNLNSGTLPAGRLPALTGDVTTAGGSAATTLAAGSASNLNSGTLAAARLPALTGDVTTSAGSAATTIGANKVVLSNLAQLAAGTFHGRKTTATGDVEAVTPGWYTVDIDFKVTGTYTIIPPCGFRFVSSRVDITITAVTNCTVGPTLSVGSNASNYNNFSASAVATGFTTGAANGRMVLSLTSTPIVDLTTSGLVINVTGGATATVANGRCVVDGSLVPV